VSCSKGLINDHPTLRGLAAMSLVGAAEEGLEAISKVPSAWVAAEGANSVPVRSVTPGQVGVWAFTVINAHWRLIVYVVRCELCAQVLTVRLSAFPANGTVDVYRVPYGDGSKGGSRMTTRRRTTPASTQAELIAGGVRVGRRGSADVRWSIGVSWFQSLDTLSYLVLPP
jgi:hypothetical protein